MAFWCWIPILTKKLHFKDQISRMIDGELEYLSASDEELIPDEIKTNDYAFFRYFLEGGAFAIVCIEKYKIEHIIVFGNEDDIKAHAQISIDEDGIVEIKLDSDIVPISDKIKPAIARRIYIIVRNSYAFYINREANLNIIPVLADNKKEAIEKLLNQYDSKILLYMHIIEKDSEYKSFDCAMELLNSYRKEMEYASRFVEILKDYIDDFESYLSSFQSPSFLVDELEFKYNINMSTVLHRLTYVIIFLTLPMTFVAINSLLKETSLINTPLFEIEFFNMIFSLTAPKLIASFYFVILFLSIIKLRHFIYLSIKSLFKLSIKIK